MVYSYATHFIEDNRRLLKSVNLYGVDLQLVDSGSRVSVSWTQATRALLGNKENYHMACYADAEGRRVLVFVAEQCGQPPPSFSTNGYSQHGGVLHFVYANVGQHVAFVIHPNSWGPYQKRFFDAVGNNVDAERLLTDSVTTWGHWAVKQSSSSTTGAMAGAAVGTTIVPGVGTVVGAIAGAAGSYSADAFIGDYCRFIGP